MEQYKNTGKTINHAFRRLTEQRKTQDQTDSTLQLEQRLRYTQTLVEEQARQLRRLENELGELRSYLAAKK
jgi:predicted RNase H-like nuclease (RuvC/YqgF family)